MKRLFGLLSLLVVLSLALAGCGTATPQPTTEASPVPPTTEPVEPTAEPTAEATAEPTVDPNAWVCPEGEPELVVWHSWQGDYFTSISALFDEYMDVCPNVSIELVDKSAGLSDAVTAAVPAGEGPDVVAWVNDQIGRLAEAEIIVPIDGYVDADAFADTFIGTAVTAMKYQGETFGFPESMEALSMIYNKALISEDELPETTDELLSMAADWDASDYLFVYNAKNDAYFSAPWWQAGGVTIIDDDGNTTFGSDEGYAVGEFINALSGDVMPEEIDYGIADTLFKEGKAAITMNGPWYIADLDTLGMDYGLKTLPVFSPTGVPATPFVGVKCIMLTKNAEDRDNAEAAVNVLEYFTSADSQVALSKANKTIPTNAEAAENPEVQALSVVAAFGEQAALGKPMPSTAYMGAMWDPIAKGLECLWTNAGTVQECVDRIQTLAEENIAGMQ